MNAKRESLSPFEFLPPLNLRRFLLEGYFILLGLVLLRFGIRNARNSENWTIGDWLINYRAGFVRRGLTGDIALSLAHAIHIPAPWIVLALQMVCYAILLLVVRRLILSSGRPPWVLAILLSPATLMFPLLNIYGGYRKEILFFALLSGLIYLAYFTSVSDRALAVYLAVCMPVLVLCHESVFFYNAYVFAALCLCRQGWRRAIFIFMPAALLSCGAVYVVSHHLGNEATARTICSSAGYVWQGRLLGPCGGGIFAISTTPEFAHADLVQLYAAKTGYRLYPLLAVLAALPLLAAGVRLCRYRYLVPSLLIVGWCSLLSGIASGVLFYFATDWGRWIYIHIMTVSLLMLVLECRRESRSGVVLSCTRPVLQGARIGLWAGIAMYALCWDLPPMPADTQAPLGVIRIVRSELLPAAQGKTTVGHVQVASVHFR